MSKKHPVIAVTGSSGAGTTFVKRAFEYIFKKENINPLVIEGDSFHKYNRKEMKAMVKKQESLGNSFFSHFGSDANLFEQIEKSFQEYGKNGSCSKRYYLHSEEEAKEHNKRLNTNLSPGEFTPWENTGQDTDLLLYEGLHGAVVTDSIDVAKHADLKIGVVPVINLEWIQKIHRDKAERGYLAEETVATILRRMPDYINYITTQFSRTDINFQRVATVDTSNPFIARDIPTPNESFVVIHFNDLNKTTPDFDYLLKHIKRSFKSRNNTIVIPGEAMSIAMEIILQPIINQAIKDSKTLI
jgi:phosphoribulokinase